MNRKEALKNIALAADGTERQIEAAACNAIARAQSIPLTCFPDLYPQRELAKTLTPKEYGQALLNRKKKIK